MQASSYGAIVKLVASGAGIGIVALSTVKRFRQQRRGTQTREPWARRDLRGCVLRNTPVLNPFRDRLREVLTGAGGVAA